MPAAGIAKWYSDSLLTLTRFLMNIPRYITSDIPPET